jgi:hypothetical protein
MNIFVDKDTQRSSLTVEDIRGCTPLQLAVRKFPLLPADTIKDLFDAYVYSSYISPVPTTQGKKIEQFDKRTGLLGVHLNVPDKHGFTSLHYAILYSAPANIVKKLVEWSEPDVDPIIHPTPTSNHLPPISPLHLAILAPRLEWWDNSTI